jgi:hypothetical protein
MPYPFQVTESITAAARAGADIDPNVYDRAIQFCIPPMSPVDLEIVINAAKYGMHVTRRSSEPVDHTPGAVREKNEPASVGLNAYQTRYAALLDAAQQRRCLYHFE